MSKGWRDLLRPNLSLVFIGFNPSLPAWKTGYYYANPTNRFYALLYASGLTPRLLAPSEDELLFDYGIGATDLLALPSARSDGLPSAQFRAGVPALTEKIERFAPKAVCCNGVGVFRYIFKKAPAGLGLQAERSIGKSAVFVVPSTSGLANGLSAQRAAAFQELADWRARLAK